jgi:plastocyanin
MRTLFLVLSLLMIALIAACSPSAAPTPAPVATSQSKAASSNVPAATATAVPVPTFAVEANDDFFRPEKFTITVGTKVTWTNMGKKKHTVTFGTLFDTDIKPGETFSLTFDKPGTYQYYCVTHSESDTEGMVGTITVTEKK